MGCIECFRCEKFQCDFVAQTFALVQNVSPRLSQGNQMVVNAPKRYKNAPKHEFKGPIGWIGCVRRENNPTRLRGTNFCTSSACFAPSFVRQSNGHKCIQIVRNALKHEFRVAWGGPGAFVAKNPDTTLWHELLQ